MVGKLRDCALNGTLLGDSGYAYRAYLLTPILKLKDTGEVRYNTAHRRIRCVIERYFGWLAKMTFSVSALRTEAALANTLVIILATTDAIGNAKRQLIINISRYFA